MKVKEAAGQEQKTIITAILDFLDIEKRCKYTSQAASYLHSGTGNEKGG